MTDKIDDNKIKTEFELKEKLYCLNGDEKFECEIAIKNKILEA